MQVNGSRVLTYVDFLKGLDPKGNFLHRCINLAVNANEFLEDMTVIEANNGTALETTYRTEVQKPVWTQYYKGVPSNKGSKAKLSTTCGEMATKITIAKRLYDKALAKGQAYADALLEDEIVSAQDGMRFEMGNQMIYGTIKDNPLAFNGLFKHYDAYGSLSFLDDNKSAFYTLNAFGLAGGANAASEAALGSIALVGWGPNAITAFHEQNNNTGGIEISDRELTSVLDPDGPADATYQAYLQYLYWKLGLAVRDFRCGGRICNIQRDDMLNGNDKGLKYIELIDRLSVRCRENDVRQAFYMDRLMWENITVFYSRLTRQNAFKEDQIDGRKRRFLKGIPVRIQDCMKVNESPVPAFAA